MRHGRTAWNADRRFQGQTDIPLDDEGRAQAQALGTYLHDERFDVAATSDLQRAVDTAEAICAGRTLALTRYPALREMRFGAWEGLTWDQIRERFPDIDYTYEKSPRNYTPEGGESWDALCARVETVLRDITAPLGADDRALIVSHAGVMHAMARVVSRGESDPSLGMIFKHASIMRLSGSFASGWTIVSFNEVADSPAAARTSPG